MKQSNRRSAKTVIEDTVSILMSRPPSEDKDSKLAILHSIAIKMSWNKLANKIRFSKREPTVTQKAHWYQE